jgi:hypothetical protein
LRHGKQNGNLPDPQAGTGMIKIAHNTALKNAPYVHSVLPGFRFKRLYSSFLKPETLRYGTRNVGFYPIFHPY